MSVYLIDILIHVNATQDELRRILWERIHDKKLTGLGLAKQTGFEQAYISNFLNRKRSLSFEGMDRVLAAQNLSIFDLLSREEIEPRASPPAKATLITLFLPSLQLLLKNRSSGARLCATF
ncbi:MAG TPA: helix-turn-helix domain-containing protein [Terriglobales bacterium]|nr:helix-turn-helix domain-containing protein [Terriglobales bacterium]